MNRNYALAGVIGVVLVAGIGLAVYFGNPSGNIPAPVVSARPVTDVECGQTYEFVHMERFRLNGRVAVNFSFGGNNRDLQPQYIWAENVIGQPTEIRRERHVDPSLKYSTVTFVCDSDPVLEGHKVSNIEVKRYRLNLRRPLRPQHVIRQGGPARQ